MQPLARIFALVPDCHAAHARYVRLWRRHFYDGLCAAAPHVVLPRDVDFGWARPAETAPEGPRAERTEVSERLFAQIRDACPDAVLSYCFASDLDLQLVYRTVDRGIPWINFFCDSTFAFDRVEPLARAVSLNWFPECEMEARYRATGRRWLSRPYAMNPDVLFESPCESARHAVGFVGAPTSNRVQRLACLRLVGCPVEIRGEGWNRARSPSGPKRGAPRSWRERRSRGSLVERAFVRLLKPLLGAVGPLEDKDLGRFVSDCRVMLGLNEGRDVCGRYRSYLKIRDIEFPGYGACYLTQHNDDIERAFDVGREVLTFRSISEAAAIIRECVRSPARSQALGRAARRRVLAEHTWKSRLRELAEAL